MGRVVIFKKRIDLAPDDLYIPAGMIASCRFVWIPILSLSFYATVIDKCDLVGTIGLYLFIYLILSVLELINEIIIINISMSGTVNNPVPRKKIKIFTHIEIILLCLEFGLQIYGMYVTFNAKESSETIKCFTNQTYISLTLVRIVAIWSFIVTLSFFIALTFFVVISRGKIKLNTDYNNYIKLWKRRINWLFSKSQVKDGDVVIGEMSQILADYFKDVDWAPSDIAVGLILLKREQKLITENNQIDKFSKKKNKVDDSNLKGNNQKRDSIQVPGIILGTPHVVKLKDNSQDHKLVSNEIDISEVKKTAATESQSLRKSTLTPTTPAAFDSITSVQTKVETSILSVSIAQNTSPISPLQGINSNLPYSGSERKLGDEVSTHKKARSERALSDTDLKSFALEEPIKPVKMDRAISFHFSGKGNDHFEEKHNKLEKNGIKASWMFSSYAFSPTPREKVLRQPDLMDVTHFCHYANMAYIQLDNDVKTKLDMLIHFSPLNDLFRAPYLVTLDHDWNTIVISIRGTYSAADILVDLSLNETILDPDLEHPELYWAHSGFMSTASNIAAEILNENILEKILHSESGKESQYQIVVCGHSLGAGVAALIAYMLRKHGYTQTRCYGYAMPGGLLSEHAAPLFNDFCLSVVVGDDIVSRLNIHSMNVLKADVQRSLEQCNLPKYKIFGSVIGNRFQSDGESSKSLLQRTQNGTNLNATKTLPSLESELERIRKTTLSIPKQFRDNVNPLHGPTKSTFEARPTFLPGRILYLEKIRTRLEKSLPLDAEVDMLSPIPKRKRGQQSLKAFTEAVREKIVETKHQIFDSKYQYVPRWATRDEFKEIMVSRTMLSDHVAVFGIMELFESEDPTVPLRALS